MSDPPPSCAEGLQSAAAKGSLGEGDCAAHDREAQSHRQRRIPSLSPQFSRARDRSWRLTRERFHAMTRTKEADRLDPWLAEAKPSLISSFAAGIARDKPAVPAAITEPWTNGRAEAQITKLKLVRSQMYGRANCNLPQARLLDAT
jgi:transposase